MGLKSVTQQTNVSPIEFAPYMGLKSVGARPAPAAAPFAPYMGLKRCERGCC